MEKILIACLICLISWSCTKDEVLTPVVQMPSQMVVEGKKESMGTFTNGVHAVSGMVKVIADKTDSNKKYLSLENFKTDAGPDLYIYLAEDKNAKEFISVVKLDKTGTFVVDIPSTPDLTKKIYVLIWCKQFSVLFGSAKLE